MTTFTKENLLPKITRRNNQGLEDFVVRQINEEIKIAEEGDALDFVQMQYFYESVFDDQKSRQEILDKVNQQ